MTTGTMSAAEAVPVADRFRFSDDNPMTLVPYTQSRFGDLPGYVTHVIEHEFGLTACSWDALVATGEASTVVGQWRTYSIAGWLSTQATRRQQRRPGRQGCPDCWDTYVEFDTDGSLTGTIGNAVMCMCAHWSRVLRPAKRRPTGPLTDGWPGAPRDYR